MKRCLLCGKILIFQLKSTELCPRCRKVKERPSTEVYYDFMAVMLDYPQRDMPTFGSAGPFFAAGETCLSVLPDMIQEWILCESVHHCKEYLPPDIPCRDLMPEMYMRFGKWEDARRIYKACLGMKALSRFEYGETILLVDERERVAKETIEFIKENDGILQRNIYKYLNNKLDHDALCWFLRFSKQIHKIKNGNTNELHYIQ